MINLCDSSKYTSDERGNSPSRRTPRPDEDIELVNIITSDETLNMSSLSSCGLQKVGALSLRFDTIDKEITINGNGSPLSSTNTRQPNSGTLELLNKTNPQRVIHGWYTINPTYGVNVLITNGKVKLNNIGFNNNSLVCNTLELQNSAYANGILDTNFVTIKNSFTYDTTIDCTGVSIENNSKVDSLLLNTESCSILQASIADCTINSSILNISGSTIIDSNIDGFNTKVSYTNFLSNYSYNSSLARSGLSGQMSLDNCILGTGSSFIVEKINLNDSNNIYGNINSQLVVSSNGNIVHRSATLDTENFQGQIENRGKFYTKNMSGITTSAINNNGGYLNISVVPMSGSIENTTSGVIDISSNLNIFAGYNDGLIKGVTVTLSSIENRASGQILTDTCYLSSGSINNGYIKNAVLNENSNNDSLGFIEVAVLYDSINSGTIQNGTFLTAAVNNNKVLNNFILNSGAVNNGSGLNGTIINGINNGIITNGKFFNESINNGVGVKTELYDSSQNLGSVEDLSLFNMSRQTAGTVQLCSFYNGSKCSNATVKSGIFYDFAALSGGSLVGIGTGLVRFNDTSISINSSISQCVVSYNDASSAINTNGLSCTGYFYDQSHSENSDFGLSVFNDSTYNLGNISSPTIFKDNSYNSGIIQNAICTFSGVGTCNYGQISNSPIVVFEGGTNQGDITNADSVTFNNNAKNFGQLINCNNILFANGSISDSAISISSTNIVFSRTNNQNKLIGTGSFFNANNYANLIGDFKFFSGSNNYGVICGTGIFDSTSNNYGSIVIQCP
jgi:hypothetical protein